MPRSIHSRSGLLFLMLVLLAASGAMAQESEPSTVEEGLEELRESPLIGSMPEEEYEAPGVSGDWGGHRKWLFDHGVVLNADLTQGVQSVMDGGFDEDSEYLGSSEITLDLDSEKLGLWPGGFLRVAGEGRFGDDVVGQAGTLSPVNNDALFPSDPDRAGKDLFAVTELTATQFLAPWIGFYGGLLNTTGGDSNDYAGNLRSNEYFQNLSFLASAVSLRIVPSVTLGGGVVVIPFDWLMATFTFMNTEESAGSDPFETDKGVTFVSEVTASHELFELPVRHVAAFGLGFDNDFFRLGELPRLDLPPGAPPRLKFATKDESWAFWYNGQIDVWHDAGDPERRAGFFFRFGYADDETNPIEWNIAGGIGGTGVFDLRPRDRFGVGIYHIEPSDNFPLPAFGVDDETGLEAFYNFELIHGLNLTFDVQYIDTAFDNGPLVQETPDNAWVGGVRLRIAL